MKELQEYKDYIVSGDVNQVRIHPSVGLSVYPSLLLSTHSLTMPVSRPRLAAAWRATLESVTNFLGRVWYQASDAGWSSHDAWPPICTPCVKHCRPVSKSMRWSLPCVAAWG